MLDPAVRDALHARLDASHAALFASLEGVTERDFGVTLDGDGGDGETVVQALAALASAERHAVADASGQVAAERAAGKPLPPQVVHALAGARYQTRRYLDSAEAQPEVAERLVAAVDERERAVAARIEARPRLAPPPVFPIVEPRRT